jgi:uncharacterized protein YkwD
MKSLQTGAICILILVAAIYPLSCREPEPVLQETGTMLEHHNLIRGNLRKPLLVYDYKLSRVAQAHSEKMAEDQKLYHSEIGPRQAENIASGTNLTETEAVKLWWKSLGHRQNLLGNYSRMGHGKSQSGNTIYYTVIFEQDQ